MKKTQATFLKIISVVLVVLVLGCKSEEVSTIEFFPGIYPGKSEVLIKNNEIVLENKALKANFIIKDRSIILEKLYNKYDKTSINLESVKIFGIEMSDGNKLSNLDFKLNGELKISDLKSTDSLPTKSLRYSGKKVMGVFISKDTNISIQWSAHLREGDNYIRQNIIITTLNTPVQITKVTCYDGQLMGATYDGSVLGSPITYKNFFFGLEHPIAHSKALLSRTIGRITDQDIDVNHVINEAGDYVIAVEHGGGSEDYNINTISLINDNEEISVQKRVLNGYGGNNLYYLKLNSYDVRGNYKIHIELKNREKATGTVHIYKKTDNVLNFYVNREDELKPGKSISEWMVMGVSPEKQQRRAFHYYIERERARPYKQFLHYNCWWDITDDGASSFTSEQLIERMHAWNKKFIEPFDIKLDAFVFDDGWDDLDSVWYFDPVKFPNGFKSQAELCKKYGTGIGVWMSPFGGYLENKRRRVESAKREGLETNDKGLSLAGTNYYQRFYERAADMLTNYKVNYFKFDGFGGSEPEYLPDMEAGARLIKGLRKLDSDVFVNITVGSWPSPFWLQYADCTWRGSGDLHNAGEGSKTQKFMTYRDGTLHNNIVKRAPYYPLNSIMTVGIAYANLGHPSNYINDNLGDFKDMVRSFFGGGSCLQELYISHDRMKPEFWLILAEATKWSKENEQVLRDTHWIGGSPINLEVYGFASWKPGKGIITLRNPSDRVVTFDLSLNDVFELPENYKGNYELSSPWKEDINTTSLRIDSNVSKKIVLKPFETKILEAYEL